MVLSIAEVAGLYRMKLHFSVTDGIKGKDHAYRWIVEKLCTFFHEDERVQFEVFVWFCTSMFCFWRM